MEGRSSSIMLAFAFVFMLALGSAVGTVVPSIAPSPGRPVETRGAAGAVAAVFSNETVFVREGLVLPLGPAGAWDDFQVTNPAILIEGGLYKMWYHGCSGACSIGYATSSDGMSWTKKGEVLLPSLIAEGNQIQYPSVLRVGDQYWMWYNGWDGANWTVLAATSPDGTNWTKRGVVLATGPLGGDDAYATLIPHVLFEGGIFRMYYTGFPGPQPAITKIMLAASTDGLNWTRMGVVLSNGAPGSSDSNGLEAPAVAKVGASYEMVYRGQNSAYATSLMDAISQDGIVWRKLGVVLSPLAPSENILGWPDVVPLANGTTYLYYGARAGGYDLQIYRAASLVPSSPTPPSSQPPSLDWLLLVALVSIPAVVLAAVAAVYLRRRPKGPP